jgi:hypothetical protein
MQLSIYINSKGIVTMFSTICMYPRVVQYHPSKDPFLVCHHLLSKTKQRSSISTKGCNLNVLAHEFCARPILTIPINPAGNWQYDVFISHAGPIKNLARDLENDLHGLGFTAFVDVTALHPGDKADQKMIDMARKAPIGLVLFDKNFVLREWPMAELKLIVEADTLLPVVVGMSHTELKTAWQASDVATNLDDAFFERVTRTTFLVDQGGWQGELRQKICFAVTRMFVERVCSRLLDAGQSTIYVIRALKAAEAIINRWFRDLNGRDYEEAEKWVRQLKSMMS